jgi:hypothetical protein
LVTTPVGRGATPSANYGAATGPAKLSFLFLLPLAMDIRVSFQTLACACEALGMQIYCDPDGNATNF